MSAAEAQRRILVVNPNTTQAITEALKPLLAQLETPTISFQYFTAPDGVPSVNDIEDAEKSSEACIPHIRPLLEQYDAFLVACYSPHPLVSALHDALLSAGLPAKPVAGIFEASIATCLAALKSQEKFGIVSTGAQWAAIMDDGIALLLGSHASGSPRYAGTETTGLNANELHDAPKQQMTELMSVATKKLLTNGAKAICLGCAGMAGFDRLVRNACIEHLGEVLGRRIRVVDGVVSGALQLQSELRIADI